MKGQQFSIDIDDYIFHCVINGYTYQPPMGKWADSDWDAEGYEELEFDVDSVFVYNDEGDLVEILDKVEKENIISDYVDRIESKILEEIREEAEDYIDYPEDDFSQYPDYYDY